MRSRARTREQRRPVDGVRERVEPAPGERRRLADHPVGRLRAERQLETDATVRSRSFERGVERARERRPRIVGRVAADEAHVGRPRGARRVLLRRLEADQHRLALAREDAGVVALHPPEVRQVEDVVRRAHDERVEPLVRQQGADAIELRVVARPGNHT
jgi:hypothetical protein